MASIEDLFGTVEGLTGPMGSGKTNDFLTRIKRMKKFECQDNYKVIVVKPSIDDRKLLESDSESIEHDPKRVIESRDGITIRGVIPVADSSELVDLYWNKLAKHSKLMIAVSEVQFFDSGIVDFIKDLDERTYLLWEGLETSFRGEPFLLKDYRSSMTDVIRISDKVERKRAVCESPECTRYADFTQRMDSSGKPDHWSSELIVVGAREYQARCQEHHIVPGREDAKYLIFPVQKSGKEGLYLSDLHMIGDLAGISPHDINMIIRAYIREGMIMIEGDSRDLARVKYLR